MRKKKTISLHKRRAISGYLFILPFIIGFLAFLLKPMIDSLYMSFCNVEAGANGFTRTWAGFDNYIRAFTIDTEFNRMLVEEFWGMLFNSVSVMIFSFFVAIVLNQKFKGRAFVRAIFFLPVILSSGVILGVETNNTLMASIQSAIKENTNVGSITGAIETILMSSNVGYNPFLFVFKIIDQIYDVAIASGIEIIIFLSGLQTIPVSVYEAADIEGCTAWEKLWKITFPMISSLFLVNWIYSIIDYCMRSDGQIMEKVRDQMVIQMNYGFSSAMAWVYFLVVTVVIVISSVIISKGVYYYD